MPSTRRRRISGVGFRIYTYLSLLLILAPAAWLLISVVTHAAAALEMGCADPAPEGSDRGPA